MESSSYFNRSNISRSSVIIALNKESTQREVLVRNKAQTHDDRQFFQEPFFILRIILDIILEEQDDSLNIQREKIESTSFKFNPFSFSFFFFDS